MNIIKFKNIECPRGYVDDEEREMYNIYFKGRYCYAIGMKKCFLMVPEDATGKEENGLKPSEYERYENFPNLHKEGCPVITYKDFKGFIDATDAYAPGIPSLALTSFFMNRNDKVNGAPDIDIHKIRKYRREIAKEIIGGKPDLTFLVPGSEDYCAKKEEMLAYYASDMDSETLDRIKLFSDKYKSMLISSSNNNSCGCHGTTTAINTMTSSSNMTRIATSCGCSSNSGMLDLSTYLANLGTCDIYQEYRKMLKAYMFETFSSIDFWAYIALRAPKVIDNIIDLTKALLASGLSIFGRDMKLDLNYPCGTSNTSYYDTFVNDMNNFIESLTMILNKDMTRTSFIQTSLSAFATYYEYMQWEGRFNNLNIFDTNENYE